MKYTIIPETKVKTYSRVLDKYNELMPVELKDGRYFIDADYLKPEAMVNPKSIFLGKTITTILAEIQDSIKTYSVVELTKDDFKIAEIEPKIISK